MDVGVLVSRTTTLQASKKQVSHSWSKNTKCNPEGRAGLEASLPVVGVWTQGVNSKGGDGTVVDTGHYAVHIGWGGSDGQVGRGGEMAQDKMQNKGNTTTTFYFFPPFNFHFYRQQTIINFGHKTVILSCKELTNDI